MDRIQTNRSEFAKLNYAGIVILLACILGGGTEQGLWTDHLIEIVMIPAMIIGFSRFFENNLVWHAKGLIIAILAVLLLQFAPYSPPRSLPEPITVNTLAFWSISPSASLNASLYTICLIGFALFVATFPEKLQMRLIRFIHLGLLINILIGVVQLSYSGQIRIEGVFPFEIRSALFANENHLSAFLFMTMPLFAWRYLSKMQQPIIYAMATFLIVAFLFAVGSRAGMAISSGIAIIAGLWFWLDTKKVQQKTVMLLVAAAGLSMTYLSGGFSQALEGDLRLVFFENTFDAFTDHWLTGTGLGTFTTVYPYYQSLEEVLHVYANHAHNDYLELLMEVGIVFVPLLLVFLGLLLRGLFGTAFQQAASLSLLTVIVHSLVDYPLRTFAVAVPFAVLSAIMAARMPSPHTPIKTGSS